MKVKNLFIGLASTVLLMASFVSNATIITIDNTDSAFSSIGFNPSTYEAGFIGSNYLVDQVSLAGDSATWNPTSSMGWVAGLWKVEAIWTSSRVRASKAAFTVSSLDGLFTQTFDQRLNNLTWMSLGNFYFSSTSGSVTLDDRNSKNGEYVIADAIRFTLIEEAVADIPAPGILLLTLLGLGGIFRMRSK